MEDLKHQASELYRQRAGTESLPSSSLSMKKLTYIALVLVVLSLASIEIFHLSRSKNSTSAGIAQSAPSPALEQLPAPGPEAATNKPAPPPVQEMKEMTPAPTDRGRPEAPPQTVQQRRIEKPPVPKAATRPSEPIIAAAPQPTNEELIRRDSARTILIEHIPSLAGSLSSGSEALNIDPEGADTYKITITLLDDATGLPAQYVWRVNISTRSVTPLSYYARKLP